jgi:hypothetical protein
MRLYAKQCGADSAQRAQRAPRRKPCKTLCVCKTLVSSRTTGAPTRCLSVLRPPWPLLSLLLQQHTQNRTSRQRLPPQAPKAPSRHPSGAPVRSLAHKQAPTSHAKQMPHAPKTNTERPACLSATQPVTVTVAPHPKTTSLLPTSASTRATPTTPRPVPTTTTTTSTSRGGQLRLAHRCCSLPVQL